MVSQLHNFTTLKIMNSTYVNNKLEYYGSAVCFASSICIFNWQSCSQHYDDNVVQISDCIFSYNSKQV